MIEIRPSAQFSEYDIIRALNEISFRPLGRDRLSKILDLSESSTRSMMSKLVDLNFAENSTRGLSITEAGEKMLKKIKRKISDEVRVQNYQTHSFAMRISGALKKVNKGLEQRDAAVKAGAEGALVLINSEIGLNFPGETKIDKRNKELFSELNDKLVPNKDAVIIVSFGKSDKAARDGLWNAVKTLVKI